MSSLGNLFCGSSLSSNGEELCNDFKGHALCFRNFQEDEYPSHSTHNSIDGEDTSKSNGVEHNGERVGDNDVSDPKSKSTYSNADSTNAGGKYLRAEDIWDRTKAHNKGAEVYHNTNSGDHSVHDLTHVNNIAKD
uniref:Uncharacterized protein n=1 Tax=Spongospora subterranea TaxID=70186 RepID=A0A0H5QHK2_9EUKA|eukprot:CRZ00786.1 hypothetical protein [Spongospora subterranea]